MLSNLWTLAMGIGPLGPWELLILLVLALLIFGKRLPEVGKSLGKGIIEFKKGLSGVEDEIESAGGKPARKPAAPKQIDPPAEHAEMSASTNEPAGEEVRQQAKS